MLKTWSASVGVKGWIRCADCKKPLNGHGWRGGPNGNEKIRCAKCETSRVNSELHQKG
jgi:hypothetical protein